MLQVETRILSSVPLAEDLGYETVVDYIQTIEEAGVPGRGPANAEYFTALGWANLEAAVAAGHASAEAGTPPVQQIQNHLEVAVAMADRVVDDPTRSLTYTWQADRLQSSWPLFLARAFDTTPTEQVQDEGRLKTAQMIREVWAAPLHTGGDPKHYRESGHTPCFESENHRFGVTVKLATQLLWERSGEVIYPGSDRESIAASMERRTGHDLYDIQDGKKLPVRTLYVHKQRCDPRVGRLSFKYIAGMAAEEIGIDTTGSHEERLVQSQQLIEALVCETEKGSRIASQQQELLDAATDGLQERISKLRAQIKAETTPEDGLGRTDEG